jgi:hypothetical protein
MTQEVEESDLPAITQMARLRFLGEEVAKQYMTEDELILATMANLKYLDLNVDFFEEDLEIKGFFCIWIPYILDSLKYGFVNENYTILPIYDDFALDSDFKRGLIKAKKNHKWGVIDKKENEIVPFIYDNARNIKYCK